MWQRFVTKLIYFALACPFLMVAWIGVSLAANPQRYSDESPARLEELPTFQRGPLMGWYVYVYVAGERVVCANPKVWDGPKVISCTHILAIDNEAPFPSAQDTAPAGPLADVTWPSTSVQMPGEDPADEFRAQVELLQRRISGKGRNDTR